MYRAAILLVFIKVSTGQEILFHVPPTCMLSHGVMKTLERFQEKGLRTRLQYKEGEESSKSPIAGAERALKVINPY